MQKQLEKEEVLPVLEKLFDKMESGDNIEIFLYEKDALKQVIMQYEKNETPILSYYSLENWLYEQKGKPIEIQLAIAWGGLWVLEHMQCIDCDIRNELYGKFVCKHMELI